MSNELPGMIVTLVHELPDGSIAKRRFPGMTEDDMVFTVAALTGRRMHTPHHDKDLEQLKAARLAQVHRDTGHLTDALYEGLGWWTGLLPKKVMLRILHLLADWFMGTAATWTSEIVALHAELLRAQYPRPVQRIRSAAEHGPRILCTICTQDTLLAMELPAGWTKDANGLPHCPEHPAVSTDAEPVVSGGLD